VNFKYVIHQILKFKDNFTENTFDSPSRILAKIKTSPLQHHKSVILLEFGGGLFQVLSF